MYCKMVLIVAPHHTQTDISTATSVLHRLADQPALSPHLKALGCDTSSHHSQIAHAKPKQSPGYRRGVGVRFPSNAYLTFQL